MAVVLRLPLGFHISGRFGEVDMRVDMVDPVDGDEMVHAASCFIHLRKLDFIFAFHVVDDADMLAVSGFYFHMLGDFIGVHGEAPWLLGLEWVAFHLTVKDRFLLHCYGKLPNV